MYDLACVCPVHTSHPFAVLLYQPSHTMSPVLSTPSFSVCVPHRGCTGFICYTVPILQQQGLCSRDVDVVLRTRLPAWVNDAFPSTSTYCTRGINQASIFTCIIDRHFGVPHRPTLLMKIKLNEFNICHLVKSQNAAGVCCSSWSRFPILLHPSPLVE